MGGSSEVKSVPTADPRTAPAIEAGAQAAPGAIGAGLGAFNQFANAAFGGMMPQQQVFQSMFNPLTQMVGLGGQAGQSIFDMGQQFAGQGGVPGINVRGGGGVGGPRGTGMITDLANTFLTQGEQATRGAFESGLDRALGQLRAFAPSINATAFQQQGIDASTEALRQRQAQLNELFTGGGQLGLGARGQDVQRAIASAQIAEQAKARQQAGDIFNATRGLAGFQALSQAFNPLIGAGVNAAGTLGGLGQQAGDPLQAAGLGGAQIAGLGFGFPGSVPPTDTVVQQNPGFFNTFIAPFIGAGATMAAPFMAPRSGTP